VEVGQQLTANVTLTNGSSEAIGYYIGECGAMASMTARVDIPTLPSGRDWTGRAAEAKAFLLAGGPGGGIGGWIRAGGVSCGEGLETVRQLQIGDHATTKISWVPSYIQGVPIAPGQVPIAVSMLVGPPMPEFGKEVLGTYGELRAESSVEVTGSAASFVTQGEAVDAVLTDQRFLDWLNETPIEEWRTGRVFLEYIDSKPQGIVPAGSSWEVDLFRGESTATEWAIAFVDPATGDLLSLTLCDRSCEQ
jgi:hypothetical protein